MRALLVAIVLCLLASPALAEPAAEQLHHCHLLRHLRRVHALTPAQDAALAAKCPAAVQVPAPKPPVKVPARPPARLRTVRDRIDTAPDRYPSTERSVALLTAPSKEPRP